MTNDPLIVCNSNARVRFISGPLLTMPLIMAVVDIDSITVSVIITIIIIFIIVGIIVILIIIIIVIIIINCVVITTILKYQVAWINLYG